MTEWIEHPSPPSLADHRAALLDRIRGRQAAGISRPGLILAYGVDDPAMDQDLRQLIGSGRAVIRESGWTGRLTPTYFLAPAEWGPES
jgi:hypothetical protein